MATRVQLRRGTSVENSTFIGAEGELIYTTDTKEIFVHDGTTAGGIGIQGSSEGTYTLPTASTTVLGGVKVDGTTITVDGNGVITSVAGAGATSLLDLTDVGADGTSGQVLTTDGAGNFTFTTVSSGGASIADVQTFEEITPDSTVYNYIQRGNNTSPSFTGGYAMSIYTIPAEYQGTTDKIRLTSMVKGNWYHIQWFDSSDQLISVLFADMDTALYETTYTAVGQHVDQHFLEIPATAAKLLVNSFGIDAILEQEVTRPGLVTRDDIKFYINSINDDVPFEGKNVHWMGTSIPNQGMYPERAVTSLGGKISNVSVASSMMRSGLSDGSLGGINYNNIMKSFTVPSIQKQAWIDDWDNFIATNNIAGSPASPPSAADQAIWLWSSYDKLLDPWLDGTFDMPDLFVFDHGHNDWKGNDVNGTTLSTIPSTYADTNYFIGAMDWAIDRILEANKYARIVLIGHHTYNKDAATVEMCDAQVAYAEYRNLPLLKLWEHTGLNKFLVPGTQTLWSQAPWNTYDTAGYPTTGDMPQFKVAIPDGVHPHSDLTFTTQRQISSIITEWIKQYN